MSNYIPDRWVVVKISGYKDSSTPVYKVFASWYGGWAGSDSWKLNSGITKVSVEDFVYSFEGSSGSVYECHQDLYGTNMYGHGVLQNMIDKAAQNGLTIEILPEGTNFLELKYD